MRLSVKLSIVLLEVLATGVVLLTPNVTASQGPMATPQSTSGYWIPYGPAPLENCGEGTPLPDKCTGRISAIAIDPRNPNTIYVGAATGGVWKSIDEGKTWNVLTDNLTEGSLAIGALAIDPNGVIYAGTGDGNWAWYGSGILKSSDSGATWNRIGISDFARAAITKIVIDPTNPNKIFATATFGFTMSAYSDGAYVDPGVNLGVFLSTDGGRSWTLSYTTPVNADFDHQAFDVVIDPTNPSTVYAAVNAQVIVSHDGGVTWTGASNGLPSSTSAGRIALGLSVSSHLTIYAAVQYFDGTTTYGVGRLYKTTNGGTSWTMLTTPPAAPSSGETGFCGKQCDYDIYVAVDPTDPNTIYLGGLDIYRSVNGGATWIDLGGYMSQGLTHVDQHALAFSPVAHSTIYIGNDGGIWTSTNADSCSPPACWTDLNEGGLSITQFYSIAVDPKDSSHLIGGTQDNGCLSHKGITSVWMEDDNCGDGGWTAFDNSNPQILYESQQWSCFSTGCTPVYRSDDGGANWVPIQNGLTSSDKASFHPPMAIDQANPSILYLGTTKLYETTTRGDEWFNPDPSLTLSASDCTNGECFSAIAVASSADNFVYAGTSTGRIFASNDKAKHFTPGIGLPSATVTAIAVDPTIPMLAYATFSGFGNGHVFTTSNGGSSWKDISSNLPDDPTESIALSSDGSSIYVGTDHGAFVSVNDGVSWAPLGRGLPRVPVLDLKLASDGRLWAATHGRGAWTYSPKILVTLSSVPNNATVLVDGVAYAGSQLSSTSFSWDPGSTHTLQVQQIEMGAPGVRYIFEKWSDGSTQLTETITATRSGDYSPTFETQFLLTVASDYDSPQGSGWYDQGTTATYSISPETTLPGILGLLGATGTFIRWSNGVPSTTGTVVMYAPLTVQAQWRTDYTIAYITSTVIVAAIVTALFFLMKERKSKGLGRKRQFCTRCGKPLPRDSSFCMECGARVRR